MQEADQLLRHKVGVDLVGIADTVGWVLLTHSHALTNNFP